MNETAASSSSGPAGTAGRWVYDWERAEAHRRGVGCRYCGRINGDCRAATCMACGTVQCDSHNGRCIVCYVGFMPNWSRSYGGPDMRVCGYAGCDQEAVAKAPRVGRVCRDHLGRATELEGGRKVTLAEKILRYLRHRDGDRDPMLAISLRPVWVDAPGVPR